MLLLWCWFVPAASGRQPTEGPERRTTRHGDHVDRERANEGGNGAGLPRSLGEAVPVLRLCCWRGSDLGRRTLLPPNLPEQHDAASGPTTRRAMATARDHENGNGGNGLAQTLSHFFFLGKVSENPLPPLPVSHSHHRSRAR